MDGCEIVFFKRHQRIGFERHFPHHRLYWPGSSITRLDSEAKQREESGQQLGICSRDTRIGLSLVMCQFHFFTPSLPTMDGTPGCNQKALASPLSEVHTGPVTARNHQELTLHWWGKRWVVFHLHLCSGQPVAETKQSWTKITTLGN